MRRCWPVFIVFFLFLFSSAAAVGIAPASMTVTLQPGTQQTITYYAINNKDKEIEVEVYVEAAFLQNVRILQSRKFMVPPNGVLTPFAIAFITPKNLPAGDYDVRVGVREAPGVASEGLSARVAAESILHLENPEGAARLSVSIAAANLSAAGQPAYFYIKVDNPTPAAIGPVSGELAIKDSKGNEVYSAPLQTIGKVQPSGSTRVTGTWSNTKVGTYTAVATITYAGQADSAAVGMQVGRQSVEILKINVTQQDNLAVIMTDVKNNWAEPMQVYAEAAGYYKGDLVGTGKSSPVKLEQDASATLRTEVDIKDWRIEELDFDVLVFFDGHTTQQSVTAEGYFPAQYQAPPLGAFAGAAIYLERIKPAYIIAILLVIIALILYKLYSEEDRKFGR